MRDHSNLIAELGVWAADMRPHPASVLMNRAADALFSQTSLIAEIESRSDSYVEENGILAELLSEAREEIERLKGLVAGIRECPQELAKVEADDPPEGNWFNHRSLLPNALQEHWQDIATAPKDGTDILLYGHGVLRSGGVYAKGRHVGWSQLARDGSTYWATRDPAVDCEPTHWMRLPTPPSALEVSDDRE
jgi:hypothetical protein